MWTWNTRFKPYSCMISVLCSFYLHYQSYTGPHEGQSIYDKVSCSQVPRTQVPRTQVPWLQGPFHFPIEHFKWKSWSLWELLDRAQQSQDQGNIYIYHGFHGLCVITGKVYPSSIIVLWLSFYHWLNIIHKLNGNEVKSILLFLQGTLMNDQKRDLFPEA